MRIVWLIKLQPLLADTHTASNDMRKRQRLGKVVARQDLDDRAGGISGSARGCY
jgi:hypothetical protein